MYTKLKMIKKQILQIRNAAPQDFGGGERYPVLLANELSKLGVDNIILSGQKKLIEFARQNNVPVKKSWWWQNQNWSGKRALLFPVYFIWQIVLFFYYLIIFMRLSPSVVHIQSKDDFISATIAAKTLNKRVVWTDHADLKHIFKNITKWYKNPTGHLVYFASRFTDGISVVSKSELSEIKKSLPKNSPLENKVKVIHNGSPDQKETFAPISTNSNEFTFLIASRLVKDKGVSEAIQAFIQLNQKFPKTKLIILGEGQDEALFEAQAKTNKNIKFLGYQKSPLDFMAKCDVFLLPTYHEGFSVALVEAAMLGLPVIATSVGGNVEIIKNEHNGLLVPARNIQLLHDAMKKLYENQNLTKKLGDNNRHKYLDNYVFSDIVEKDILSLYGIKSRKMNK